MFPAFYFCTSCDYWDTESKIGTERSQRQSRTYSCKANHKSWIVPTEKLVFDPPKKRKNEQKESTRNNPPVKKKAKVTSNTSKKNWK